MRTIFALLICLSATLCQQPISARANLNNLSSIIESFMAKQFPEAKSHFWVINGTQWQTEDEIVVDLNAVVTVKNGQTPTESRYLLLIVGDTLAAAQNIPMDAGVDCQPEQT